MPTVVVQTVQRIMHRAVFVPIMTGKRSRFPAAALFVARRVPAVRKIIPRFIAFGPRPEHAPAFARRAPHSAVPAASTAGTGNRARSRTGPSAAGRMPPLAGVSATGAGAADQLSDRGGPAGIRGGPPLNWDP